MTSLGLQLFITTIFTMTMFSVRLPLTPVFKSIYHLTPKCEDVGRDMIPIGANGNFVLFGKPRSSCSVSPVGGSTA